MRGSGADLIARQHHGLEARAAHLVHRGCGHLLRHTGGEGSLTARGLSDASHQHATKDRFLELRGVQATVLDGSLRGGGTELWSGQWTQCALKSANRRATGGDDENLFTHGGTLVGDWVDSGSGALLTQYDRWGQESEA